MRSRHYILPILIVMLLSFSVVFAQTDTPIDEDIDDAEDACPVIVERALLATRSGCDGTERNQICYGHRALDAQLRSGFSGMDFNNPGDILDIVEFQSLSLSALDTLAGIWGVVLMELQADLELVEPGNVTFIVFGDAELESATNLVSVTAVTAANIRDTPVSDGRILGSLTPGESRIANGISEDGEWLRIQIEASADPLATGWVSITLLEVPDDVDDLAVIADADMIDFDPALTFGEMQAFYFQSGRDDAPCAQAPNSGMMIQTPEGEASVSLWIDEVIVELNATAFIQAQPDGELTINVLDGSAQITSDGETRTAVAGTQISVPLNADLGAAGAPNAPTAFNEADLQSLPTELLSRQVEIPAPLNLGEGVPASGLWRFAWGVESLTCPDGDAVTFESEGVFSRISVEDGGQALLWDVGRYNRASIGTYTRAFVDGEGNLHQDTLTVTGLDRIVGEKEVDFAAKVCTLNVPFQLQLVDVER